MIVGMTPSFMQGMGLSANANNGAGDDGSLPLFLTTPADYSSAADWSGNTGTLQQQVDRQYQSPNPYYHGNDSYDWRFDWKIYTAGALTAVVLYWLLKKN